MTQLQCHGAIEEIQDYIAANSGLGYTVGTNFVIGDILDLATLGATKAIDLTMYDEGATLEPSGRRWHMHRDIRFVFKGDFGQGTDWKEWSPDMQAYCKQDVAILVKLWHHFQKYLNPSS